MDPVEEIFGKRHLLKYNKKEGKRVRPIITSETRKRKPNNMYNTSSDFVGAERGTKKHKNDSSYNRHIDDDEEGAVQEGGSWGEEDIYAHVDLGCYGLDGGGKLDFK